MYLLICLSLLLVSTVPLHSLEDDVAAEVRTVQNEFWAWRMRQAPEFATFAGVNLYNDQLDHYNMTIYTANKDYIVGLLRRLTEVKTRPSFSAMSYDDSINYLILTDMLQTYVDGYDWHLYSVGNPVSFLEGPQLNVGYRFDICPFDTRQDFIDFLSRMKGLSDQIDDMITLMRGAISRQFTNHNVSMGLVIGQIDKIISAGLQGEWFTLYKERVDNSSLSDTDKNTLISEARNTVLNSIIPAYQRLKDFIVDEYVLHTRPGYGVSSFTNGAAFYQAALTWHLSVHMTPDEVHQKGLKEVARIAALMRKIFNKQNFTGSIKEKFDQLKADPQFHTSSKEEILARFNNIVFNRITPKLTQLFKDIPNLPVKQFSRHNLGSVTSKSINQSMKSSSTRQSTSQRTNHHAFYPHRVMPMQYDGPGGVYFAGSADGKRPGVFQVNLQHPETVNFFGMAALSLHETVPGHHLQQIYSLESALPLYRRTMDTDYYYRVPFHFPFYTAYTEGWGLYAEFLGEELGVYEDDYELLGRYSEEMLRAVRLVVDTGMHAKGWTRDQAINYMLKYTSSPRYEVEIEIDRYITWPGQACAYKIGELKLRELRETARKKLGFHFDVRDFHSTILNAGALPIRVLEKVVNDWVRRKVASVIPNPVG
ncbi:uncharacterized protein LOC135464390 [Liolophura sinensis]|uniref:uncharacterized protein LOC135464390 n=1 Tax=Liolophura sinensis TaxID=3198878 RepID=UPI0031585A86